MSVFLSRCVCVSVEQTAIRQEPRPSTSTGLFLPVGWFLPLRSLHFLHTHISLQQPYLFLNLAQVLWTPWTSNNNSSISLSICLWLSLSIFFFLLHFSLLLSSTLQVFTFHLISPGNMLLKRVSPGSLRLQSQGTFAQNLSSCNFLPFSAPRVLFNFLKKKNACNIPETCWVDPAPLPFHNFLVTHVPMGQIFYFCN